MSKAYLDLRILGSAGSYPTKERNVSAIYGATNFSSFLLDVGEGCQKSMLNNGLSLQVDWIFLSHFHTDHILGIFGLLNTLKLHNRVKPLTIYSPDRVHLQNLFKVFYIDTSYNRFSNKSFQLNLRTINQQVSYFEKDLIIRFFERDHYSKVPGIGNRTYGIHIYSASAIRYDKQKLDLLDPQQKKDLFLNKEVVVNNEVLTIDHFIASTKLPINMVYTSDGTWDSRALELLREKDENGLLITECTHFFSEDLESSHDKKHTHFKSLHKLMIENPKITFLLTHLGSKLTLNCVENLKKRFNIANCHWAKDNLGVGHNNLLVTNEFL